MVDAGQEVLVGDLRRGGVDGPDVDDGPVAEVDAGRVDEVDAAVGQQCAVQVRRLVAADAVEHAGVPARLDELDRLALANIKASVVDDGVVARLDARQVALRVKVAEPWTTCSPCGPANTGTTVPAAKATAARNRQTETRIRAFVLAGFVFIRKTPLVLSPGQRPSQGRCASGRLSGRRSHLRGYHMIVPTKWKRLSPACA